ncbi:Hypothetical predicted protein [Pelobates cultripes]|uniref:Amelotin n=1 Tax=Pelobates cultripes TaxID=61616 RepID=A0AAD1VXL5_PELCU|nr:Hypothetical predicted protein [Pelobates cultripes]
MKILILLSLVVQAFALPNRRPESNDVRPGRPNIPAPAGNSHSQSGEPQLNVQPQFSNSHSQPGEPHLNVQPQLSNSGVSPSQQSIPEQSLSQSNFSGIVSNLSNALLALSQLNISNAFVNQLNISELLQSQSSISELLKNFPNISGMLPSQLSGLLPRQLLELLPPQIKELLSSQFNISELLSSQLNVSGNTQPLPNVIGNKPLDNAPNRPLNGPRFPPHQRPNENDNGGKRRYRRSVIANTAGVVPQTSNVPPQGNFVTGSGNVNVPSLSNNSGKPFGQEQNKPQKPGPQELRQETERRPPAMED